MTKRELTNNSFYIFSFQLTPEATCILEHGSRMKVTFYIELVYSLQLNLQLIIAVAARDT